MFEAAVWNARSSSPSHRVGHLPSHPICVLSSPVFMVALSLGFRPPEHTMATPWRMLASRWVGPLAHSPGPAGSLDCPPSPAACPLSLQVWRGALTPGRLHPVPARPLPGSQTCAGAGAGTGLASIIAATVAQTVYCTGNAPAIPGWGEHSLHKGCADWIKTEGGRLGILTLGSSDSAPWLVFSTLCCFPSNL